MKTNKNEPHINKTNRNKPKTNTELIYSYFEAKKSPKEIQASFNLSKSTISQHKKNWQQKKKQEKKTNRKEQMSNMMPSIIKMIHTQKSQQQKPQELEVEVIQENNNQDQEYVNIAKEFEALLEKSLEELEEEHEKLLALLGIISAKYVLNGLNQNELGFIKEAFNFLK